MPDWTYDNFDVHFSRTGDGYAARVFDAPDGGEAHTLFTPPFAESALAELLAGLRPAGPPVPLVDAGHPAQTARKVTPGWEVEEGSLESARRVGGALFAALFAGEMGAALQRSLDTRADRRLRIRLRFGEAVELNSQPWEYLYDPDRDRFLGFWERVSIVRFPSRAGPIQPLTVSGPLQVLVMASQPVGVAPLDVEAEWAALSESLRELQRYGRVALERCPASLDELVRRLRRGPHVFHFIGHGSFDPRTGGQLQLEGPDGRGEVVAVDEIGQLLTSGGSVRLAILNACESGRPDPNDPFAGAAQHLVKMGVQVSIGMQFSVSDPAAIAFSRDFYGALSDGYPVETAAIEGRKAMFARSRGAEWGTPVLCASVADTRLFAIEPQAEEELRARRAAALDDDARTAHTAGRWDLEIKALEDLIHVDPQHAGAEVRLRDAHRHQDVEQAYKRGLEHYDAERWRQAFDALRQVINLAGADPRYLDVYPYFATARRQLARTDPSVMPSATASLPTVDDPIMRECATIADRLVAGRVVVILGSAVNLCGRPNDEPWEPGQHHYLPSAAELAAHLAELGGYPARPAGSLASVSQHFATSQGSGTLRERLRELLDADYPPTAVHQVLSGLSGILRDKGYPPRYPILVTTNYDDVLERALTSVDVEYDRLTYTLDEISGRGWFVHRTPDGQSHQIVPETANTYHLTLGERPLILKVHGAIDRLDAVGDSYVIAEDDYIDYAGGGAINALLPADVIARLRSGHLLFLGYDPSDWSLRVFFRWIWRGHPFSRYRNWSVGATDTGMDQSFWDQCNVGVLQISLEDFIAGLTVRLATLPPKGGST